MKKTLKVLFAATLLASQAFAAPAFALGPSIDSECLTGENSPSNSPGDCFWLMSLFGACR